MEYTVTSFKKNKKGGGQITVTVGEGRNKRSFTRHLNPGMIGLNIDERAIPLNERYEQELAETKSNLASAKVALKNLRDKLTKTETEMPKNINEAVLLNEMKTELAEAITRTELEVYAAEAIVDDAETKLDIVRRELPLMMEFNPYQR